MFDGVNLWIWNLKNCDGGNFDTIAQRCKQAGVTGVIVKAADGAGWFNQGMPFWQIAYNLQQRGLNVAGWMYNYLDDPLGEAQRAIETISYRPDANYRGPDAFVFDVEQECEGKSDAASALLQRVTTSIPADYPLAYAPLPSIRNHLGLPYYQFTTAGCVMLPQLYWTLLQWPVERTIEEFYADANQYHLLTKPVFPAYCDVPGGWPTDGEMQEFVDRITAHGSTGCNTWSYEHLDANGWSRVQAVAVRFHSTIPVPQSDATASQVTLLLQNAVQRIATGPEWKSYVETNLRYAYALTSGTIQPPVVIWSSPLEHYQVTQRYGPTDEQAEPIINGVHFHQGVDLAAPEGTPIQSATDGYVTQVQDQGNLHYGKSIQIRSEADPSIEILYGHESLTEAIMGQHIQREQEIGRVGHTGNATGPHVHFAVLKDGQFVDPAGYISLTES